MQRFHRVFKRQKTNVIGMIHVEALPGTPFYRSGSWQEIIEKAKHEADIYRRSGVDSVLIENMHDIPYVPAKSLGPESTACMASIAKTVRQICGQRPIGIQILAGGNQQALAVAKACDLQFIRAEGFVFAHVADEGLTEACAGQLLRYRNQIDANDILIFADIKKKHSSHAITQDVSLLETAKAAEFFASDGLIITGNSTGDAVKHADLLELHKNIKGPLIIGSGVTKENLADSFAFNDAVIVGSHFKVDGHWKNNLCEKTVNNFMGQVKHLRAT